MHIIIAERNRSARNALTRILTMEGYDVSTAASGRMRWVC